MSDKEIIKNNAKAKVLDILLEDELFQKEAPDLKKTLEDLTLEFLLQMLPPSAVLQ